jgi:hypothetical protein
VQRRNAGDQLRWVHRGEGRGRSGCEGICTLYGVKTRGKRSPRGARIGRGLNNLGRHRTQRGEQGPEGEGAKAGAGVKPCRLMRSTTRGHDSAGETRYGSAVRDNPLKGKPWTWQRGETNPQRLEAEQTLEVVRNGAEGT